MKNIAKQCHNHAITNDDITLEKKLLLESAQTWPKAYGAKDIMVIMNERLIEECI